MREHPPEFEPTPPQLQALEAFRLKYSDRRLLKIRRYIDWVEALQCAWAQGWDDREPGGGCLRMVRNTPGGHEWLQAQRSAIKK